MKKAISVLFILIQFQAFTQNQRLNCDCYKSLEDLKANNPFRKSDFNIKYQDKEDIYNHRKGEFILKSKDFKKSTIFQEVVAIRCKDSLFIQLALFRRELGFALLRTYDSANYVTSYLSEFEKYPSSMAAGGGLVSTIVSDINKSNFEGTYLMISQDYKVIDKISRSMLINMFEAINKKDVAKSIKRTEEVTFEQARFYLDLYRNIIKSNY